MSYSPFKDVDMPLLFFSTQSKQRQQEWIFDPCLLGASWFDQQR